MGTNPNPDPRLAAQPTEVAPQEPKTSASEPQHRAEVTPASEIVKPVHDPNTIIVEHNDADPNSPTYRPSAENSTPEV